MENFSDRYISLGYTVSTDMVSFSLMHSGQWVDHMGTLLVGDSCNTDFDDFAIPVELLGAFTGRTGVINDDHMRIVHIPVDFLE